MSLAATRKMIEPTFSANKANDGLWIDTEQEETLHSGKCDLCGEPLVEGERFTHKACSDYENFLASQ